MEKSDNLQNSIRRESDVGVEFVKIFGNASEEVDANKCWPIRIYYRSSK